MSYFLIYFEIGKPVQSSPVPASLWHSPVSVSFQGRASSARLGMTLRYGERFLAFGNGGLHVEGETVRAELFRFLRQRLDAGARPHLVFLFMRGSVDTATVDMSDVVRVPLSELEEKFRAIAKVRFMDSSETIEVTTDAESAESQISPASNVLLDICAANAASEAEPMRWRGNIDVLAGETLLRIGSRHGTLEVLRSIAALAHVVERLREGARIVTATLPSDSSPLRFVRQTTGGARAVTIVYRSTESTPVPVNTFDDACRDAVLQFFTSLTSEQRLALRNEKATMLLGTIAAVWPEVKQAT